MILNKRESKKRSHMSTLSDESKIKFKGLFIVNRDEPVQSTYGIYELNRKFNYSSITYGSKVSKSLPKRKFYTKS